MISIKDIKESMKKLLTTGENNFALFNAEEAVSAFYSDACVKAYADPKKDGEMSLIAVRSDKGVLSGLKVIFPGAGKVIFQDMKSDHSMVYFMDEAHFWVNSERDRWEMAFWYMLCAWDDYKESAWSNKVCRETQWYGYMEPIHQAYPWVHW